MPRVAVIAALLLSSAVSGRQIAGSQDAVWSYPLQAVEAIGVKRVTPAQVRALSGLRAGTVVGPQDIEAARQRLLKSGFFASVGYRFRNAGYWLVVTFTVEEVAWDTPVVFDNFVDHTDAQATAAVARELPSFDGVAPDQDAVLKRIAGALERLARESKDPGQVTYALIYDKTLNTRHWRFHLDRLSGPLPICSITVTGVPAALEAAMADVKAAAIGVDYSKDFVSAHARESLLPLLAAGGEARAAVTGVSARREPPRAGCERGVAVTVTIGRRSGLLRPAVQH